MKQIYNEQTGHIRPSVRMLHLRKYES